MRITGIDTTEVEVPFNERIEEHARKSNLYRRFFIYEVHTDEGLIGIGEGADVRANIPQYKGHSPFEHLMDDTPTSLSMAFHDLAGKATGQPAHRFWGTKVHDEVPIAYWSSSLPAEVWAAEAKAAYLAGYRVHKIKARPAYDLIEQVSAIAEAVPDDYRLRVDPNGTFEQPSKVIEFERLLEPFNIESFETPIPQDQIEGYAHLRRHIKTPITLHMGDPPVIRALRVQMCDSFIIGYPDSRAKYTLREAAFADMAEHMPVWIQIVGLGITDAWLAHLACTMKNATWSAITLSGLRVSNLLKQPHRVVEGMMKVPEGPGLGVELDRNLLEEYRVKE